MNKTAVIVWDIVLFIAHVAGLAFMIILGLCLLTLPKK